MSRPENVSLKKNENRFIYPIFSTLHRQQENRSNSQNMIKILKIEMSFLVSLIMDPVNGPHFIRKGIVEQFLEA